MRCTVRIKQMLLAGVIGLAGVGLVPAQVQAQDGWSVEQGAERKAKIVRRYKQLLEQNPVEGVIFDKLLEYVGTADGLDRLIEEYKKRVESKPRQANLRLILGHLLKKRRDYETALTHYEKAVELDPDSPIPWMSRGAVLAALGKRKKAAEDYEKALEQVDRRSRRRKLLRKLADLAFEQRDWKRAQTYYDRLIDMDPRNEYLRMEYAQVLIKHRRYEKAVQQYEKLLDLAGGNPKSRATTLRDLGDLYEKMERDDKAVETYRQAMGLMRRSHWLYDELQSRVVDVYRQNDELPELVDGYEKKWRSLGYARSMLLGKLNDEIGRSEKALEYFRRASRLNFRQTEPRERIIEILKRRGEDKKVVEAYRALIRIAPGREQYYFRLVRMYYQLGEREKAEGMLDRIERRFRRDPGVYVTLADTYMRYNMRQKALETYRALVRMEPDNESYIVSLGESYYRTGELEKAVETWKKLLDSSLQTADAHARLAQVFTEHGMLERGLSHYRKAVEARPDDLTIRRGLASTYERARRWGPAIEAWRYIMDNAEQTHQRAEARSRIIGIYDRQHRLRQRLKGFARKFEADPPDIEAGYFLAESHMKLNNKEKAEQTYRKIVEADGEQTEEDVEALEALEQIYRQQGRLEKAIGVLETLAKLRTRRQREYYHQIAELSLKLYEDDQAVRYAALAVEKNPQDASAHANLAEVYREMQRREAAVEEYRQAIDLDPYAQIYKMKLAELYVELGERRKAEELYLEVAKKSQDSSLILKSARRAMDLAGRGERLRRLESEFLQLSFKGRNEDVYRKVMLELYERMMMPLLLRRRYAADRADRELEERLERVGRRASPILVGSLTSGAIGQRALAVRLLGGLRDPTAALQLARMAVDETESLRALSAMSVAQIGSARAAGPLIRALDADDPRIRDLATWALGYLKGGEAGQALIDTLEEGQSWTQQALAALGLGRIGGEQSARALKRTLQKVGVASGKEGVTVAILWALGRTGADSVVEPLHDAMLNSPENVRRVAAVSLARAGGDAAVRSLLDAYWHERESLRSAAAVGLSRMAAGGGRAEDADRMETLMAEAAAIDDRRQKIVVQTVVDRLQSRAEAIAGEPTAAFFEKHADAVAAEVVEQLQGSETDSGRVQRILADLYNPERGLQLGALQPSPGGGEQALEKAFRGMVSRLVTLAKSDNPAVAAPALGLVGVVGDIQNLGAVRGRLGDGSQRVRAEAVRAVGRLGDGAEAFEAIVDAQDDDAFVVRAAACDALVAWVNNGGARQKAVDRLVARLDDDFRFVQVSAVRALGQIGGQQAARAIGERLEGWSMTLQREAVRALETMEGPAARDVLESWRQ